MIYVYKEGFLKKGNFSNKFEQMIENRWKQNIVTSWLECEMNNVYKKHNKIISLIRFEIKHCLEIMNQLSKKYFGFRKNYSCSFSRFTMKPKSVFLNLFYISQAANLTDN